MKKNALEGNLLITFAEANGMMDWPLSTVIDEYLTVQDNHSEEVVEVYDESTGEQIK